MTETGTQLNGTPDHPATLSSHALTLASTGLAIVAHLFSVPHTGSPFQPSPAPPSQPSPFDDPFSPFSASAGASTDLCLGLEMLRGADLKVVNSEGSGPSMRVRRVPIADSTASSPAMASPAKEAGEVEVETPTDIRMYVDRRCAETVLWMEQMFCTAGNGARGVKLEMGGQSWVRATDRSWRVV